MPGHKSRCIGLTAGLGEACTPTAIGADGAVCVIGNATLFSVDRQRCRQCSCRAGIDRHGKGFTFEGWGGLPTIES